MKSILKLFFLGSLVITSSACASSYNTPYNNGYEDGYQAGYKQAMKQKKLQNTFPKTLILRQGETLYSKIGYQESKKLIRDLNLDETKLPINFCATKKHKNAKWKFCDLDTFIKVKMKY